MKTRMQPIESVWSKLPARRPRPVGLRRQAGPARDGWARRPSSTAALLEAIKDPLTHLVRNALDHGIEAPERPRGRGKPAEGG